MSGDLDVRAIRKRLGLSQVELGTVLDVCAITVYKFESKKLVPGAYQQMLLNTPLRERAP